MKGRILMAVAAGALLLGACSGGSKDEPPATAASTATQASGAAPAGNASPAATSQQATPAATATPASATSATKVSANDATRAQLQAAFEAAGIPNAAQWAREVEEYRPYSATDTNMAKLRGELAKYNPAAGVVDKIVATLSLP